MNPTNSREQLLRLFSNLNESAKKYAGSAHMDLPTQRAAERGNRNKLIAHQYLQLSQVILALSEIHEHENPVITQKREKVLNQLAEGISKVQSDYIERVHLGEGDSAQIWLMSQILEMISKEEVKDYSSKEAFLMDMGVIENHLYDQLKRKSGRTGIIEYLLKDIQIFKKLEEEDYEETCCDQIMKARVCFTKIIESQLLYEEAVRDFQADPRIGQYESENLYGAVGIYYTKLSKITSEIAGIKGWKSSY